MVLRVFRENDLERSDMTEKKLITPHAHEVMLPTMQVILHVAQKKKLPPTNWGIEETFLDHLQTQGYVFLQGSHWYLGHRGRKLLATVATEITKALIGAAR